MRDLLSVPWRQGTILRTKTTAGWSLASLANQEAYERTRVFAHFSSTDEGRSRQLICVCESQELAHHIVTVHNAVLAAYEKSQ